MSVDGLRLRQILGLAFLMVALGATGCASPRGGGGGGGGDDDDDDSVSDDDDITDTATPMQLSFTIRNSSGYDFYYVNWAFSMGEDYQVWESDEALPDGSFWSSTGTVPDVEYGQQMHIAATAIDTDNDCYNWEDGGRDYNTGANLDIEVEFTFNDWLGGGCP